MRTNRQRGSILIVTLLAVGMLTGAFLYISVIGSRSAETTRARTAADAAAMAAATVKARTLNYEAFILLADTVLLPLGQLSQNIVDAQRTWDNFFCKPCIAVCPYCPMCSKCIQYETMQMPRTAIGAARVDPEVTRWLDGLEAMAEALDSVGPFWAEQQAVLTGMDGAYRGPGQNGVTIAASFPLPDNYPECGSLGIEMVSNMEKVQGRAACTDRVQGFKNYEMAYHGMQIDPIFIGWNVAGQTMNGKLLTAGAACDKANKVPKLGANWRRFRFSRGMALEMSPNDHWQLAYLEALKRTDPPKMLGTGWLLGMGCAEHYSQDHYEDPSLWYMDWRARLVPCEYEKREAQDQVLQCGGASVPGSQAIQLQFANQLRLGIAKDWKW
jgi:hypothetical protein